MYRGLYEVYSRGARGGGGRVRPAGLRGAPARMNRARFAPVNLPNNRRYRCRVVASRATSVTRPVALF